MADKSIYEEDHPHRRATEMGIALGRITAVYPETRLCEVKTYLGPSELVDHTIPNCQWLNLDSHPEGDESTVIPRINSYCVLFFISGQPFVFGFFSPLTGTGSANIGKVKEELNEGDRVLKTIGDNKIILRAHGEIQIESTKTNRTIYFPDKDLINTLCRNYEFRTDGGTIDWLSLGDRKKHTLSRQEWRDSITRDNLIIEESGWADDGTLIYQKNIGEGGSGSTISDPVWTYAIKPSGECVFFVRESGESSGYKLNIKPSGDTKLSIADKAVFTVKPTGETKADIGDGKAVLHIKADGTTTLDIGSSSFLLEIKPSGDTTITTKGKLTAKVTGAVEIQTDADLKATVKGALNATVGGDLKAEVKGKLSATCSELKAEVKGKATIEAATVDIGKGTLEAVLTTPSAISDFTGAPIQMGSMTVKASK